MGGVWQGYGVTKEMYRVAGRVLWQRVVGEDRVPVLGVGLLDVQAALFQTPKRIAMWLYWVFEQLQAGCNSESRKS